MSGCHSRYFDRPAGVTPGFINHPTSTSGRPSLRGRLTRKRHRANVTASPFPNPAPQDELVVTTTCSICLSNVLEPAELPCNHIFCFGCVTEWARSTATTCPLCKKEFQEVVINQGRGVSKVIKYQEKIQRCPGDDNSVGYVSSEVISSDEEEEVEVEEVPATRRGRPHGYIADGFVVVEDSEVEDSLSDEIGSVMSDGNESVEDLSFTDEIRELLEDTKNLAERGLLLRSSRR